MKRHLVITALLALVMGMNCGCSQWATPLSQNVGGHQKATLEIVPFSTQKAIALTAYDIMLIMRAANFKDSEIVTYGSQLRYALMTLGGAQVRITYKGESRIPVHFVVNADDYVLINSMASGYFVYDARNHVFGQRQTNYSVHPPGSTPVQ